MPPPYGGYRHTCDVISDVRESLTDHSVRFGHLPSPIVGIHRCVCEFDGTKWALGESAQYRLCNYLTISRGDVLVEITCDPDIAVGWVLGYIMGAGYTLGWCPPAYITPADDTTISWGWRSLIPSRLPLGMW